MDVTSFKSGFISLTVPPIWTWSISAIPTFGRPARPVVEGTKVDDDDDKIITVQSPLKSLIVRYIVR